MLVCNHYSYASFIMCTGRVVLTVAGMEVSIYIVYILHILHYTPHTHTHTSCIYTIVSTMYITHYTYIIYAGQSRSLSSRPPSEI